MTVREAVAILSTMDQDLAVGFGYFDESDYVITEASRISETRCRDIDDQAKGMRVVVLSSAYEGGIWEEEGSDE